ncbi:glycosyl transferase family 4-domain-containing protein [Kickxella alabastrina]|uniref:glycosyl transferase family 4-domain-containing protein n=1 Tax=Kickxella alabastrina TaxID=61397 RepID=UPI00222091A7|nr:glycosyl transferase family 4-domain-containing protein [Kickxella alabastrina]KAI7834503.1 glycosyl transferase family 4-domain-containing protein [Kickxella alabastrina]
MLDYKRITLCLSPVLLALLWQFRDEPLAVCTCISALAGLATWCLVPATTSAFKRVGLSGTDLSKPSQPVLAESMGVVAATFRNWWTTQDPQSAEHSSHIFPFDRLGEYLSALLSLQSMVFLGFADDVFDLRWRFKLLLPTIASIPILIVYYVGYGVTHVMVPVFMRPWLGTHIVDLGTLYYVYIGLMAVFCTNAINILAGINGVEVGQSIIIALSIIAKDIANVNSGNAEADYHHSRVFVGDTYCYFAGMTFAVCGILGHFSKTLLLLFLPQVFNFVYSAPQIFGLVPCPRHRLPKMAVESPLPRRLVARLQQEANSDHASAPPSDSDSGSEIAVGALAHAGSDAQREESPSHTSGTHRTLSTAMLSFAKGKSLKSTKDASTVAGSRSRSRSSSARGSMSGGSMNSTAYMVPSRASLEGAKPLGLTIIRLYELIGIADVERDEQGNMVSVNNLTLLNLVLLNESQLNNRILLIQVLNSVLAFIIRYRLSHLFYF